jgi:hypothetical protein
MGVQQPSLQAPNNASQAALKGSLEKFFVALGETLPSCYLATTDGNKERDEKSCGLGGSRDSKMGGGGQENDIFGFEGSQAVPARVSGKE